MKKRRGPGKISRGPFPRSRCEWMFLPKRMFIRFGKRYGLAWAAVIMFLLAAILYRKVFHCSDEHAVYNRLPAQPVIYMPMLPPMNTGPGHAFPGGVEASIQEYTPDSFKGQGGGTGNNEEKLDGEVKK